MRVTIALGLLWPSLALAWPVEGDWVPLRLGDAPITDVSGDQGAYSSYLDLLGDATEPAGSWYADETTLYLRLGIADDPRYLTGLRSASWGFLLDTDGSDADFEYALVSETSTGQLTLYETDGTDGLQPGYAAYDPEGTYGSYGDGEVRATRGTGGWFVDLRIDRADWGLATGLSDDTAIRVAIVDGPGIYADWADVAGCDATASDCDLLADVLSDPIWIDQDLDGLTDAEEENLGSDPADADTDDDGVLDPDESVADTDGDGLLGFEDCDSDGDGILDGTESGVTTGILHGDTDTAAGCFDGDANSATTTDPNDEDTDGGGLDDGVEDWNGNGRIDDWETDPNDASDDADTDGDGIADALEGGWDADEDGKDNAQDLDSDGDGIPDAVEWLYDTDEDGIPDFLDADDDGDGIPTAEEDPDGDGDPTDDDTDGDGIPDYLDDDDDGDGIPTADEGDGDVDCDGIPDHLDLDDTDGACDTGDPPVDTGEFDSGDTDRPTLWQGGYFSGGACSSVPGGVLLGPALLLAGLVLVRRRRRAGALLVATVASTQASAQDLDAQRFAPSVDGHAFVKLEDSVLAPQGALGGGLWFNHADDPFVFRSHDPKEDELAILGAVSTTDLVAFYSLGVARVGLDLPMHVVGDAYGVDRALQLGDLRLSTKAELVERRDWGPGVAAALDLVLPTGSTRAWVGRGQAGLHARLVGSYGFGSGAGAFNLGFRSGTGTELGDLRVSPALTWAAGWSQSIVDETAWAVLEADGELWLGNAGQPGARPVELLGAVRARPMGDLLATLGLGTGLSQGVGAPDVRVVASVAWTPTRPPVPIVDLIEADADGDGIADSLDRCVHQAEDFNGVRDGDGCPDAGGLVATTFKVVDPGGAAVAGARLELLDGPETGSYVASDGSVGRAIRPGTYTVQVEAQGYQPARRDVVIPEAEAHEAQLRIEPVAEYGRVVVRVVGPSGVPVRGAEVRVLGTLGKPITVGRDGILEAELPPGAYEVSVTAGGWSVENRTFELKAKGNADLTVILTPTEVVVDEEAGQIYLTDKIFFELDKAELKVESVKTLDALVNVLKTRTDLGRVRIEGHTDTQGDSEYNMDLSQARAQAVKDYLVSQGIGADRLDAVGYGETRPLQQGESDAVHATNRRVELHIVDREER